MNDVYYSLGVDLVFQLLNFIFRLLLLKLLDCAVGFYAMAL